MSKFVDVYFRDLELGDHFFYWGIEYMKVELLDRQDNYAVNLSSYKVTYFYPNEDGLARYVNV